MIDLDQASRYIATLCGSADAHVAFQTFDDGKDRNPALASGWQGPLASGVRQLERLQALGAGVFVAVNAIRDGKPRRVAHVERVRALFIDCDGFEPKDWHLRPSMVVQSGGGGVHAYWLCGDCALEDFQPAQKRLINAYGSDRSVHDLPRVLRMPGSAHQKGVPRPVRISDACGARYSVAEILAGIPPAVRPPLRDSPGLRTAHLAVLDWARFSAVQAFRECGFYRRQLDGGKHAVVCPWAGTHSSPDWRTDSLDTSTVIWDRSPSSFHCSHSHCEGRKLRDALREIGFRPPTEDVVQANRERQREQAMRDAHRCRL